MRSILPSRYVALSALAVFVLAACSQEDAGPPPECPNIVIVEDTAALTEFQAGPGRDLTDVVLQAKLVNFDGTCETDRDRDGSGSVTVDLQLIFEAERGPANATTEGSFRYFVAVANSSGAILAKEVFKTELEFEGNRNRIGALEELTQEIPLRRSDAGVEFDIFVGFQLSPDQLQYNRTNLAR